MKTHLLDARMAPHGHEWAVCGHYGDLALTAEPAEVDCVHCLRKMGVAQPPAPTLIKAVIAWHASYIHGGDQTTRDGQLCAAVDAYTARVPQ